MGDAGIRRDASKPTADLPIIERPATELLLAILDAGGIEPYTVAGWVWPGGVEPALIIGRR